MTEAIRQLAFGVEEGRILPRCVGCPGLLARLHIDTRHCVVR